MHATWPQAQPKANQVFQHLPMSDNFVIIVIIVVVAVIISVFITIIITASTIKAGGLGMMYMRRAIQV